LPDSGSADAHDQPGERFERGSSPVEDIVVAAHHHCEGAARGADRSARERSIEICSTHRNGHRVAGRNEMGGHGQPHRTEADESDTHAMHTTNVPAG